MADHLSEEELEDLGGDIQHEIFTALEKALRTKLGRRATLSEFLQVADDGFEEVLIRFEDEYKGGS